jgi:hypothetical protein
MVCDQCRSGLAVLFAFFAEPADEVEHVFPFAFGFARFALSYSQAS